VPLPAALRISIGYVGELERGVEKIDDRLAGPVLHAAAPMRAAGASIERHDTCCQDTLTTAPF